jgi:hypothetical protein
LEEQLAVAGEGDNWIVGEVEFLKFLEEEEGGEAFESGDLVGVGEDLGDVGELG